MSRVEPSVSDETASISLVDLHRARDGLRLRGGGKPVRVDEVYSLGRWVLANLFGLSVVTAFVLVTFIR